MAGQNQTVGNNTVAIQNIGNNVVISVGTSSLSLAQRHRLKAKPTTERELLQTELRGTDLVGRDADLTALRAWLNEPKKLPAVRCLTGRAGAGKTRLAIELCEHAASDWIAGFATQDELQRFHDAKSLHEWRWGKPTLIVIDYAAASARILRSWLEALARRDPVPGEGPLRLLLLERHADHERGWWSDLIRPGGLSGCGPDDLAAPAEPIALPPLGDTADRYALLQQVVGLAAQYAGKKMPDLPALGQDAAFDCQLSDAALETEPLFLLMAGIVGVSTGVPQALALSRTDLAMRIADSERHRLGRLSVSWGIDNDHGTTMLAHMAACVTLQAGCDRAATIALICQEQRAMGWQLARPPDWIAARLADALHRPEGGVDAIRPDIVSEAFLLRQLASDDRPIDEQVAIVDRAWARDAASVIGSVIRTVQDHASDNNNHPALGWLDHLLAIADDLPALQQIADSMPQQTLALRERAAAAQARVADVLGTLVSTYPDLADEQARAMTNLSFRLNSLGRHWSALETAANAFKLYSNLAAQRPDASQANLAMSINNLAMIMSALGGHEAALAGFENAVNIYRTLEGKGPDGFRPALATSLSNLAALLNELGRHEAALAAAEEAVSLHRQLAAQRPDTFQSDLAMSLNNLTKMLSQLDRNESALATAEEAVTLYRKLTAKRPDAFRPDLAMSLHNLGAVLGKLNREVGALAAAEETVALRRKLVARHPDVFSSDLAISLHNLAILLSNVGRDAAALEAAEEAVLLHRMLAAQHSDAFRPSLANSLVVLADCLDALARPEQGLAANTEAIATLTESFSRLPQAFANLIRGMARKYRQRCEKLGQQPDMALLTPIAEIFQQL